MQAGQGQHPLRGGDRHRRRASPAIRRRTAAAGASCPIVVYNPCAWPRSERVTVALYDTDFAPGRIVALDEQGKAHPTLFLGKGGDWGHEKLTVAFDAEDVPALWATGPICSAKALRRPRRTRCRSRPASGSRRPIFRFRLDRYQLRPAGTDRQAHRRKADRRQRRPARARGSIVTERPRGMTAWVLGKEMDPLTLRSSSFSVVGAARNQGTSVPNGGAAPWVTVSIACWRCRERRAPCASP